MGATDGYRLRELGVDEARGIAVFQTACWREACRGLVPDSYLDTVDEEMREKRWRDRLASGARRVVAAESGGRIVGVVSWCAADDPPPGLELKSLYVAAGHRGGGVASDLLRRALGDQAAMLWVFADNPRARGFYAKSGFVADGVGRVDVDTGLVEIRMVRGPV